LGRSVNSPSAAAVEREPKQPDDDGQAAEEEFVLIDVDDIDPHGRSSPKC